MQTLCVICQCCEHEILQYSFCSCTTTIIERAPCAGLLSRAHSVNALSAGQGLQSQRAKEKTVIFVKRCPFSQCCHLAHLLASLSRTFVVSSENVRPSKGKQIMPYLLNKPFQQNPLVEIQEIMMNTLMSKFVIIVYGLSYDSPISIKNLLHIPSYPTSPSISPIHVHPTPSIPQSDPIHWSQHYQPSTPSTQQSDPICWSDYPWICKPTYHLSYCLDDHTLEVL